MHCQKAAKDLRADRMPLYDEESCKNMKFEFVAGVPISEEQALREAAELGLHAIAYDNHQTEDSEVHFHEFNVNIWLISGEAAFATPDGEIYKAKSGCRLSAPAGWLHQELVSPTHRLVLGTNIPASEWTQPIDKTGPAVSAHN